VWVGYRNWAHADNKRERNRPLTRGRGGQGGGSLGGVDCRNPIKRRAGGAQQTTPPDESKTESGAGAGRRRTCGWAARGDKAGEKRRDEWIFFLSSATNKQQNWGGWRWRGWNWWLRITGAGGAPPMIYSGEMSRWRTDGGREMGRGALEFSFSWLVFVPQSGRQWEEGGFTPHTAARLTGPGTRTPWSFSTQNELSRVS
jgi:hypothetical protein